MISEKWIVRVVMLLVGFFFITAGGLIAEEIEPPDFIELDQDIYKSDRKGPVPFEHEMHADSFEVACNECHHIYEDGKNIWEEGDPVDKCSDCHDPLESIDGVKKLRLVFHRNCRGCHRRLIKEGDSTEAPYKCGDCHERKS